MRMRGGPASDREHVGARDRAALHVSGGLESHGLPGPVEAELVGRREPGAVEHAPAVVPAQVGGGTAARVRVGHPEPAAMLEGSVPGRKVAFECGPVRGEELDHVRGIGSVTGCGGRTLGERLEPLEVARGRVQDQASVMRPDLQLARELRRPHLHIVLARSGRPACQLTSGTSRLSKVSLLMNLKSWSGLPPSWTTAIAA